MNNIIPIEYYTNFYYQFFLIVVAMVILHCLVLEISDKKNIVFINFIGYVSLFFTVFYMGLRPIHDVFVDMTMYAHTFERFKENNPVKIYGDYGFFNMLERSAKIMSAENFFFLCATLYVIPVFYLSKKWFKEYWFYCFLILVVSFSFWAYGTNGIRNGLATSFFLLALTFYDKKIVLFSIMLLASSFHKTMLLPSLAYILVLMHNSPKTYLKAWFFSILLSLLFGNLFVELFANLGFEDSRIDLYFTDDIDESLTKTGFRWDFLIYSATGVFAGWYYIFKKGFNDKLYIQLFNIYLIANAFWVLVIRANFSNRFAYLSWFMLGVVIIYPLLKEELMKNQHKVIGGILAIYFAFTYLMNVILVK